MNGYVTLGIVPFVGLFLCAIAIGALVAYTILGFRRHRDHWDD